MGPAHAVRIPLDNRGMFQLARSPWLLLVALLLACSPALNWREARFADRIPLRMLLPCKPDRAEREVPMAGHTVPLQMLGCDTDGATFAVSHVFAAQGLGPNELLEGWRSAVLVHLQAQSVQTQVWTPPGAWASPASQRVQALGRRADGTPLALEAVWFGVPARDGVHVFHAVMLAPQARPDVAETFFSALAVGP
jgi:hypothetical protein